MKALLLGCLLLGSLGCTGPQEVYVCRGKYALRYHQRADCKGLRNCTYRVDKVPLQEAVELGRTPCHLEYHLAEK